jgi:hypothetical protein
MVRYFVLALGVALVSTNAAYCKGKKNKGGGTIIYYPQPYYPPVVNPVVVNPVVVNPTPVVVNPTPVVVNPPSPSTITRTQVLVVPASSGGDADAAFQVERFLRIKNDSGEKLTVFLQVRTRNDKGQWSWMPEEPGTKAKAMSFDLDAGKTLDLTGKVSASRVRLWARSDTASFMDYADQDLWLVPETRSNGEHRYQASRMQTYTFTMKQSSPVGDR